MALVLCFQELQIDPHLGSGIGRPSNQGCCSFFGLYGIQSIYIDRNTVCVQ